MGNNFCLGYSPESEVLMVSVSAGNQGRIKQLLHQRPDLLAARKGLSKGATSVWHCAAKSGCVATLQTLHDEALDIYRNLPLEDRKAKVQRMLDIGNRRGRTPLHIACLHGHVECVSFLTSTMGADPSLPDHNGSTAIHLAASAGHANCIRAILEAEEQPAHGSRLKLPDIPDNCGLTPLHCAAAFDQLDCAQALLEWNVYLISRTKIFTVQMGVKVSSGSTALHVAATRGSLPMVRLLLKHQAFSQSRNSTFYLDMRWVKNSERLTPCQEALRAGHSEELVELLDPSTDLRGAFDLQEMSEPVAGVPKLSVLAAAALQTKLIADLKRASDTSGLATPEGRFSPHTSYMEGLADTRSPDRSRGSQRQGAGAGAAPQGAEGEILELAPASARGEAAGMQAAVVTAAGGIGRSSLEQSGLEASPRGPTGGRLSSSTSSAVGGVLSAAALLLSRSTGGGGGGLRSRPPRLSSGAVAVVPEPPSRLQHASSSLPPIGPHHPSALRPSSSLGDWNPAPAAPSSSLRPAAAAAPVEEEPSATDFLVQLPPPPQALTLPAHSRRISLTQNNPMFSPSPAPGVALQAPPPAPIFVQPCSPIGGVTQDNPVFTPCSAPAARAPAVAPAATAPGPSVAPAPGPSASPAQAPGASPGLAHQLSLHSEEDSSLCGLCFERSADVCLGGCSHLMCNACAQQLCARLSDRPLACPFCRSSVRGFESAAAPGRGA